MLNYPVKRDSGHTHTRCCCLISNNLNTGIVWKRLRIVPIFRIQLGKKRICYFASQLLKIQ